MLVSNEILLKIPQGVWGCQSHRTFPGMLFSHSPPPPIPLFLWASCAWCNTVVGEVKSCHTKTLTKQGFSKLELEKKRYDKRQEQKGQIPTQSCHKEDRQHGKPCHHESIANGPRMSPRGDRQHAERAPETPMPVASRREDNPRTCFCRRTEHAWDIVLWSTINPGKKDRWVGWKTQRHSFG